MNSSSGEKRRRGEREELLRGRGQERTREVEAGADRERWQE